ncbi:MAG TPA: MgtC/SapB family protein [Candidatus Dormibacteraeota bacterium]|jgi:putative Mg2+ transporter-C (MgtC) family protein
MNELEFILRLASGLGCGVLIGLERQWRQRMAGLRTNTLVAAGACLFVLLQSALSGTNSADRIIAQVVSGVGFLGAGLIIRDGLNVRGVNTAATIWCAAAVGSLAGAGFYAYAFSGAAAVVLANLALRPVGRLIDHQPGSAGEVETLYDLRAVTRSKQEARIRALIVQSALGQQLLLRGVHSENLEGGELVEVHAELLTQARHDTLMEQVVSRLSLEPSVSAVTWAVRDNGHVEEDDDGLSAGTLSRRHRPLFRRWRWPSLRGTA